LWKTFSTFPEFSCVVLNKGRKACKKRKIKEKSSFIQFGIPKTASRDIEVVDGESVREETHLVKNREIGIA
jgi:hypothetical protein